MSSCRTTLGGNAGKSLLRCSLIVLVAGPALLAGSRGAGAEVRLSIRFPAPTRVVFSPDGKLLALQRYDQVQVWDIQSRKRLWADAGVGDSKANSKVDISVPVEFSPDGALLAIPEGWNKKVMAERRSTELKNTPLNPLTPPDPAVLNRIMLPTLGIQLRDATTGSFRQKFGAVPGMGWTCTLSGLHFAPDGKSILIMHVGPRPGKR